MRNLLINISYSPPTRFEYEIIEDIKLRNFQMEDVLGHLEIFFKLTIITLGTIEISG